MAKILQFVVPVAGAAVLTVVLVCFLGRPSEPVLLAPDPVPVSVETAVPTVEMKKSPEKQPENEGVSAPEPPPSVENKSAETIPVDEESVLTGENEQSNAVREGIRPNQAADSEQIEQNTANQQIGQGETLANALPEPIKEQEKDALSKGGRWFKLERENFERSENVRQELEVAKFKRRLPNGFGALGIDEAQRAEIYRIQEEYHAVLTPLYQRADRLRAERDEQIRAVLTETQKEAFGARKKSAKK